MALSYKRPCLLAAFHCDQNFKNRGPSKRVGTHQSPSRDWITGFAKIVGVESRCLDSKVSLHTERNWESIIDRFTQLLLAPDIALRRLHRRMAKEKMNLFEFPS